MPTSNLRKFATFSSGHTPSAVNENSQKSRVPPFYPLQALEDLRRSKYRLVPTQREGHPAREDPDRRAGEAGTQRRKTIQIVFIAR